MKTRQELIKELQNLYSWSEFYSKNQLWDSYAKCEQQIAEFKEKHNLF